MPSVNLRKKKNGQISEGKPRKKTAVKKEEKEKKIFGVLIVSTDLDSKGEIRIQSDGEIAETDSTDYKNKFEELQKKYNKLKTISNKKIQRLNMMLKYYKNKNRYSNNVRIRTTKCAVKEKL